MKEDFSIIIHPTNDNIRIGHSSIGRDAKTNPAICGGIDAECDNLFGRAKVPVQSVQRIAVSVRPQNGRERIGIENALAASG